MDSGKVRVYIKDTLLKDYAGHRLADDVAPLRALGFSSPFAEAEETYVKPHGRRLLDGRIVCWGRAEDWKSILMALHERAYVRESARPHAAVRKCQRKHTVDGLSPQPASTRRGGRTHTSMLRHGAFASKFSGGAIPDFANYPHPSVCKISLDYFLFARDSGTIRKVDIHVPTIAQRDDKIAIFLKLFSTDWASKKSSMRD
jgi:hypothetical protein